MRNRKPRRARARRITTTDRDDTHVLAAIRGRTRQGKFAACRYDWPPQRWQAAIERLVAAGHPIRWIHGQVLDEPTIQGGWIIKPLAAGEAVTITGRHHPYRGCSGVLERCRESPYRWHVRLSAGRSVAAREGDLTPRQPRRRQAPARRQRTTNARS